MTPHILNTMAKQTTTQKAQMEADAEKAKLDKEIEALREKAETDLVNEMAEKKKKAESDLVNEMAEKKKKAEADLAEELAKKSQVPSTVSKGDSKKMKLHFVKSTPGIGFSYMAGQDHDVEEELAKDKTRL